MELDYMMYVGKYFNIIELIGVCLIKGMIFYYLDIFFYNDWYLKLWRNLIKVILVSLNLK